MLESELPATIGAAVTNRRVTQHQKLFVKGFNRDNKSVIV